MWRITYVCVPRSLVFLPQDLLEVRFRVTPLHSIRLRSVFLHAAWQAPTHRECKTLVNQKNQRIEKIKMDQSIKESQEIKRIKKMKKQMPRLAGWQGAAGGKHDPKSPKPYKTLGNIDFRTKKHPISWGTKTRLNHEICPTSPGKWPPGLFGKVKEIEKIEKSRILKGLN